MKNLILIFSLLITLSTLGVGQEYHKDFNNAQLTSLGVATIEYDSFEFYQKEIGKDEKGNPITIKASRKVTKTETQNVDNNLVYKSALNELLTGETPYDDETQEQFFNRWEKERFKIGLSKSLFKTKKD